MSMTAAARPARIAAPAARKVGAVLGLGFRQAVSKVSAFTAPASKSAGAAAKAQAATLTIECKGRTGVCAIAKTRKAASKRFKVTASGKVGYGRRPSRKTDKTVVTEG